MPDSSQIEVLSHDGSGESHRFELLVPRGLACFDGHFPDDPIMPAAAQLDLLVLPRIEALWPVLGALRGARRLKFRRAIQPGARVALDLSRRGTRVRFDIAGPAGSCTSGTLLWSGS